MLWPSMEYDFFVSTLEKGIKVDGIAVENSGLSHCVSECKIDILETLDSDLFEVEFSLERLRSETLIWVECVEDGLLELLNDSSLM